MTSKVNESIILEEDSDEISLLEGLGQTIKILNTGAQGGIIVSPLGLQTGAKKVAEASNIESVILDAESTTTEYIMNFLNRIFIGLSDPVESTDCLDIRITPVKR